MVDFAPIDSSMRIAGAGAGAAPRAASSDRFHAKIEEFQRREQRQEQGERGQDSFQSSEGETPPDHLPTAASPVMGDSAGLTGYRPDGSLARRITGTGGGSRRVDFVA